MGWIGGAGVPPSLSPLPSRKTTTLQEPAKPLAQQEPPCCRLPGTLNPAPTLPNPGVQLLCSPPQKGSCTPSPLGSSTVLEREGKGWHSERSLIGGTAPLHTTLHHAHATDSTESKGEAGTCHHSHARGLHKCLQGDGPGPRLWTPAVGCTHQPSVGTCPQLPRALLRASLPQTAAQPLYPGHVTQRKPAPCWKGSHRCRAPRALPSSAGQEPAPSPRPPLAA